MGTFLLQMPEQFSFAVTLMNVLLVLSQTEFAQIMMHSGVMQHLWMQLLPPVVPEEITEQVNSTTVSVEMLISHLYFCIVMHSIIWAQSGFDFQKGKFFPSLSSHSDWIWSHATSYPTSIGGSFLRVAGS
jgi:hypothetical protein